MMRIVAAAVMAVTGLLLLSPGAAAGGGPPPPEGLEIIRRQEDRGIRVTLSWNHRSDCSGYRVHRSESPDGPFREVGGVSGSTMEDYPFFLDDTVFGGKTYYYRVGAIDEEWREGPPGPAVRCDVERYYRKSSASKSIAVSLADQRLYCFEDGVVVNIFRVSTGSIGPTPTGNYRIYGHRRWVENCEYWMDWKTNYGIHAWPRYSDGYRDYEESLGVSPRSHGCIRLHPLEAYWPYYWAPDGTPLTVTWASLGRLPLKGASCSEGATELSRVWYFAEGFKGADFMEYILLFNPGATPVEATLTFYPEGADPVSERCVIDAGSRKTVSVNDLGAVPMSVGHSVKVEATGDIVAQQSEYYEYAGKRGGHTTMGTREPSSSWYFAEGYTGGQFSTYLLLFNPGRKHARVVVTYHPEGFSPYVHEFTMPPESRGTTLVNALPDMLDRSVSIAVESDEPLVAGRTVFFAWPGHSNAINGGHASSGSPAGSETWYLAEGCTGHFFDEYILVSNPTGELATFNIEFIGSNGNSVYTWQLAPKSRATVAVDQISGLENAEVSAIVTSDREIVVERAMYYARDSRRGGHVSAAVEEPSTDWYFAEGYTGGTFDEYLMLFNPGYDPATAVITYHLENGTQVNACYGVAPRSRVTVHVDDYPGMNWTASAVEIHSDRPLVAEQAHYFCVPR
jgi:hypothetical protein